MKKTTKNKIPKPAKHIYQFCARLVGLEDKIWRRFEMSYGFSVAKLCYGIMLMFEMRGSHLYRIEYNGKNYGTCIDIDVFDTEELNATEYKLYELELKENDKLLFVYDFGDNWQVEITVEKIIYTEERLNGSNYPKLLEGAGEGIIEDIGGIGILQEFVEENDKGNDVELPEVRWDGEHYKWNYKKFDFEWCKRKAKWIQDMVYRYEYED